MKCDLCSGSCADAVVDVLNGSGAGVVVENPATTVRPNSWIEKVRKNPKGMIKQAPVVPKVGGGT